jgi:oxidase EvaA
MELAPTGQCLLVEKDDKTNGNVPFFDYALGSPSGRILYDTLQSEAGGRFYHDQNRYMLLMADESLPPEIPEWYAWRTLRQLYAFPRFNNFVNIQALSLIAALPYNVPAASPA